MCVDASPDFQWVVAGCHDASVHIFHLTPKAEGVQVEELAMSGYESKVKLVDFSPDGRWMASSGGRQNMVWNFQASPAGAVPTALGGHNRPITCQVCGIRKAGKAASLATGCCSKRIY